MLQTTTKRTLVETEVMWIMTNKCLWWWSYTNIRSCCRFVMQALIISHNLLLLIVYRLIISRTG
jgi:hypothetical protein